METIWEKRKKIIFYGILFAAFLMFLAYNLLTPYLSDDYAYLLEVGKAHSLWDLLKQQYEEYLSNSARVVGQFSVRLSLAAGKPVFNLVNSFMFMALVILLYLNVQRRKKYDIWLLLLIITSLWKFTVFFGQTMLWICGACNYLWGSVYILLFLTLYRTCLNRAERIRHGALTAIGMFLLGLLAGWCNENTSGGCLLLAMAFSANFYLEAKKEGRKRLYPFMFSSLAGNCCGLAGMLLAPGVRKRGESMLERESYTGWVGLLSHIYKVTMNIRRLFFVLLAVLALIFVLLVLLKKLDSFTKIRTNETVLFAVGFLATAYVLAIIPTPTDRAFFGAGIFLLLACLQGLTDVFHALMKEEQEEKTAGLLVQGVRLGIVSLLCLWLFFTYLDNLVNLARIYREENERIALIEAEHSEFEDGIVVIPRFREEFDNPYTNAYLSDLTEDPKYWMNHFYENYYEVMTITAIPRDEWDKLYGNR